YAWDFNPPNQQAGLDGGDMYSDRYAWNSTGTYPVRLTLRNCGGSDAITKQITVVDPASIPNVGFTADKRKLPLLNTVTLLDTSLHGTYGWDWEVSPSNTVNFESPTDEQELRLSFTASGFYTVKLKASNLLGTDSVTRIDYIEVFDYCDPVAGSISSD